MIDPIQGHRFLTLFSLVRPTISRSGIRRLCQVPRDDANPLSALTTTQNQQQRPQSRIHTSQLNAGKPDRICCHRCMVRINHTIPTKSPFILVPNIAAVIHTPAQSGSFASTPHPLAEAVTSPQPSPLISLSHFLEPEELRYVPAGYV